MRFSLESYCTFGRILYNSCIGGERGHIRFQEFSERIIWKKENLKDKQKKDFRKKKKRKI